MLHLKFLRAKWHLMWSLILHSFGVLKPHCLQMSICLRRPVVWSMKESLTKRDCIFSSDSSSETESSTSWRRLSELLPSWKLAILGDFSSSMSRSARSNLGLWSDSSFMNGRVYPSWTCETASFRGVSPFVASCGISWLRSLRPYSKSSFLTSLEPKISMISVWGPNLMMWIGCFVSSSSYSREHCGTAGSSETGWTVLGFEKLYIALYMF